jgi:hypothetical protein
MPEINWDLMDAPSLIAACRLNWSSGLLQDDKPVTARW